MTVLAELDGHAFDLAALARHFPTGDPHIVASDDGTYLATALDDLCGDAAGLLEAAREQLEVTATPGSWTGHTSGRGSTVASSATPTGPMGRWSWATFSSARASPSSSR